MKKFKYIVYFAILLSMLSNYANAQAYDDEELLNLTLKGLHQAIEQTAELKRMKKNHKEETYTADHVGLYGEVGGSYTFYDIRRNKTDFNDDILSFDYDDILSESRLKGKLMFKAPKLGYNINIGVRSFATGDSTNTHTAGSLSLEYATFSSVLNAEDHNNKLKLGNLKVDLFLANIQGEFIDTLGKNAFYLSAGLGVANTTLKKSTDDLSVGLRFDKDARNVNHDKLSTIGYASSFRLGYKRYFSANQSIYMSAGIKDTVVILRHDFVLYDNNDTYHDSTIYGLFNLFEPEIKIGYQF